MSDHSPCTVVFAGPSLRIGLFRCNGDDESWRRERVTHTGHMIIFPRLPALVAYEGGSRQLADSNTVLFSNLGQIYERERVIEQGYKCEWFAMDGESAIAAVEQFDPSVSERSERPFTIFNAPVEAESYVRQRQLLYRACSEPFVDAMEVEESFFNVLDAVLARAYDAARSASGIGTPATQRAHAEAAEAARRFLATHYHQPLALRDIARTVHLSSFHLCRIFRSRTGFSVHQYLRNLRLRAALDHLDGSPTSLEALALRVGFSSHAHMTRAFQSTFGTNPTELRSAARGRRPL